MGEREWWQNFYPSGRGRDRFGLEMPTREECAALAAPDAAFRIHVRLKPEGAPKRYASEAHKWAWENDTEFMRGIAAWAELEART